MLYLEMTQPRCLFNYRFIFLKICHTVLYDVSGFVVNISDKIFLIFASSRLSGEKAQTTL